MAYLWGLIAGGLLALPFKFPKTALLGWVGLIPFLFAVEDKTNKQAFYLGWIMGVGFFGVSSYWLIYPVINFSGYPWIICILLVGLALIFLALYFGLFSLVINIMKTQLKLPLFLIVPIGWTGIEFFRTLLSFQFLFGFLGYSQSFIPQLIQLAQYGGVHVVTFILILVNTLLYLGLKEEVLQSKLIYFGSAVLIFCLVFSYGQLILKNTGPVEKELTLGVVQPSIPQHIKLNPSYQPHIEEKIKKISNRELIKEKKLDLLIWPETAILRSYDQDQKFPYKLNKKVPLLIGGFIYQGNDFLNSALLIDESRNIIDRYSKNRLVPWGEYVPFPKLVPDFIETNLNHITPGTKIKGFNFKGINWITPICSEILNPLYIKKLYRENDLIINLSNEAWFEKSHAPLQVFQAAVFRAVETQTPIIKAANTGISGAIDNRGRILTKTELFKATSFRVKLKIPAANGSWYDKYGNLFGISILLLLIILSTVSWIKYKKSSN